MHPVHLPALATRLRDLRTFVEIARFVCQIGVELGLLDCRVMLHAAGGRPMISVDNARGVTRAERVAYLARGWLDDRDLAALRDRHVPIDATRDDLRILLLPVVDPTRLIGSIAFRHHARISPELRGDLTALAAHVSVRIAQLGIAAPAQDHVLGSLTPRQRAVALLVARGRTNGDIAAALGVSENTVKKHLKDIYARLELDNRTELAAAIAPGVGGGRERERTPQR
jgi:DNA-binding CsgD family transcriptional regulator